MCATSTYKALAAALLVVAAPAQEAPKTDRFPLEKVDIQGTAFPRSAVLRLAGLKTGAVVSPADFEAAARKLQESGLFQNVAFRYAPGAAKGYVLSFEITDFAELTPASIEVPEVNEDAIWKCAAERFPVVPKRVPADEPAERVYADAIQQCLASKGLKEEIVARSFSSLESGKSEVLFQLKNLPAIAGLEFTGVKALKPEELLQAMSTPAMGSEYTERTFRNLLRLNVVPIYEESGRLRVSFPKVIAAPSGSGTVSVTTTVDEGPVYTLGSVQVSGQGVDKLALIRNASFRIGQVANWNDIRVHLQEVEKELRRGGYLAAQLAPERHFNDTARVVDLEIVVNKGPQFYFGQLRLTGFSADLERRLREAWKLKPGSVLDQEYPYDFVKGVRDQPEFNSVKKFDIGLETGAAQNVMDVVITAR